MAAGTPAPGAGRETGPARICTGDHVPVMDDGVRWDDRTATAGVGAETLVVVPFPRTGTPEAIPGKATGRVVVILTGTRAEGLNLTA